MSAGGPLLAMRGVSKVFGANRALDGVSLALGAGEVHALIGENGAGKSTLMKILSGALRPDSGSMTLAGVPYAPSGPRGARDLGVAMIYQELTLAPHLTVEANVMLGRERTTIGLVRRREHRRLVAQALGLLEHPDIRPEAVAGTLSVGAQQLVEVARALVSDARVIVFDEPTSSLTERDAERLFEVIDRLRARGLAIVYISHFLEEVRRVAQRYTILRDGRAAASGSMAETPPATIIAQMVGRELIEMFPRVPHEPGEVVLDLGELAGRDLPRRADLQLQRGEVLGIAGLVGAGRTELLRAVFGLAPVRSGRVRVKGLEATCATPARRIAQGLGLLSEDRKGEGLALGRSIEDNLTYSALGRYARLGWLDLRRRRAQATRWMGALRVRAAEPAQAVGALSGGNQQKVALARLLHQEADVLLLDEPTRGIDVGSKAEIYRLIGELAAQGKAVVMVSSYLPELMGVCDRLAVMIRGVLSPARPVADWTEHSVMEMATGANSPAASARRPGSRCRQRGGRPVATQIDVAEARPGSDRLALRGTLGSLWTLLAPFLGLLLIVLLFVVLTRVRGEPFPDTLLKSTFLTSYNWRTILVQTVIVGIAALGMMVIMIAGGIDLSVGSAVALVTVIIALMVRDLRVVLPWAMAVGVLIGGLCGLLNGILITGLGVVPFIITLGGLKVYRGLAKWLSASTAVYMPEEAKSPWFNQVLATEPEPSWLVMAPGVWMLLGLSLILALMLRYSLLGRYVSAIGSNEATAWLCGIGVPWVKLAVYTLAGLATGLAGVMQFIYMSGTGDPTSADGLELQVIAAVVIGGGSLNGGEGTVLGTLIGCLMMSVLNNGCVHAGISNASQDIIIGVIIIAAVALDRLRRRGVA
jgi:ribose transport system ATP-binding protein